MLDLNLISPQKRHSEIKRVFGAIEAYFASAAYPFKQAIFAVINPHFAQ